MGHEVSDASFELPYELVASVLHLLEARVALVRAGDDVEREHVVEAYVAHRDAREDR